MRRDGSRCSPSTAICPPTHKRISRSSPFRTGIALRQVQTRPSLGFFHVKEVEGSLLAAGDLLVTKSSGSSLHIGKTTLVTPEIAALVCCYSNFMQRIRLNQDFLPKLAWFVMNSDLARLQFDLLSNSSTGLANLNGTMIGQIVIPVPSVPEQTAIVAFLDRETAKIDDLVAEQQNLIALLKEKRQALISHAVTKGLDPNVPMKDSGVEWLGKVPAHWSLKRLGYLSSVVRGASPRPAGDPRYFNGDYIPWVTVAEITKDDDEMLRVTEAGLTEEGASASRLLKAGTVIYSNSGATLGVPKILAIDACANDGVVAFERMLSELAPRFLYRFLLSMTQSVREMIKQGSGQPNLNTDIVKAFLIPLPPKQEQQTINEYLDDRLTQFSQLISEAESTITLLQERRTALISAAVTGKIDVRNVVSVEEEATA